MDYSQIIPIALLVISELLPFLNMIPSNGITHTLKVLLVYIYHRLYRAASGTDCDLVKQAKGDVIKKDEAFVIAYSE